jgi:hypothetical protein
MSKKYPLSNPMFCHHHVDCQVDLEFKLFSQQRQEQVKRQKRQDPDKYARQRAEEKKKIAKLIEQEREMKKKMNQDPELKKFREEMRRKKQRGEKR